MEEDVVIGECAKLEHVGVVIDEADELIEVGAPLVAVGEVIFAAYDIGKESNDEVVASHVLEFGFYLCFSADVHESFKGPDGIRSDVGIGGIFGIVDVETACRKEGHACI